MANLPLRLDDVEYTYHLPPWRTTPGSGAFSSRMGFFAAGAMDFGEVVETGAAAAPPVHRATIRAPEKMERIMDNGCAPAAAQSILNAPAPLQHAKSASANALFLLPRRPAPATN